MPEYAVNDAGIEHARRLIDARRYVLSSEWGQVQPKAGDETAYLEKHGWPEYAAWFLGPPARPACGATRRRGRDRRRSPSGGCGGNRRRRTRSAPWSRRTHPRNRLRWAEQNEQAFKGYNERRAAAEEAGEVLPDEPVPFACECDDPGCARAIEIPVAEYERAVAPVDRFIVLPGHEDPEVEVVVERHDGYRVVSKPDLARRSG